MVVANHKTRSIITTATKRDWAALEAKIANGKSIKEAALEAGIPDEEAAEYCLKRLDGSELKLVAAEALKTAFTALEKIVKEGPRVSFGEAGTPISSDLDAAKALARLAIDAIKLSNISNMTAKSGQGSGAAQPSSAFGADLWDLKTPGAN